MTQIALSNDTGADVLNIVHPRPVPWNRLFTEIATDLSSELNTSLLFIPYSQWISKLEQFSASPTEDDLKAVVSLEIPFYLNRKLMRLFQPGLKILQFLRNLNAGEGKVHNIQYTTTKAEENSEALKNMQALDEHQVVGWISYWKKIGFLPGSPRNGVTQRL